MTGRSYRLTQAGRKLFWESQNRHVPAPAEYRRILGLVEFQGHSEVIRGYLRRYPDQLVDEWLTEVQELGLIEAIDGAPEGDLVFSGGAKAPPLLEEDKSLIESNARAAGTSLSRTGVYIADERARNRAASGKARGDTVVLIVEDDPDQRALAELRVKLAGFAVRLADSAKALLGTLQQHGAPDLMLLDVVLPDGDGFDILAELRRHPTLALLPVVMLTSKDDPADIAKGLALGADGYITKPYGETVLADIIAQILKL